MLVTSKGEPALAVLQDQIPENLRNLTISLLTSERQGMKQLEGAVQLLAGMVSQTNLDDLKKEAKTNKRRVRQVAREIRWIDTEIQEWGLKQLNYIDNTLSGEDNMTTAMDLALRVVHDADQHQWMPDQLGSSDAFNPQFTDSDIAALRQARRKLGQDISYVDKQIPMLQDMPDTAAIAAIHDDLAASSRIAEKAQNGNFAPLAVSAKHAVKRAKSLIAPLNNLKKLLDTIGHTNERPDEKIDEQPDDQIDEQPDNKSAWIGTIFYKWLDNPTENHDRVDLFEDLMPQLKDLMAQRQIFVKTLVEIDDPSDHKDKIEKALERLSIGKKAFGPFSFGNKETKTIIKDVRVDGEFPEDAEQWQVVLHFLEFQDHARRFIVKWNHIGQELEFPQFTYQFGDLFKDIQTVFNDISAAENFAKNEWQHIRSELAELFPHGIDIEKLPYEKQEIEKTIQSIELSTSRISLGAKRLKLRDLSDKLKESHGKISEEIKDFIKSTMGNPEYSSDDIMQMWQDFTGEIERLHRLNDDMETVGSITQKIAASGAAAWAESLKTTPVLKSDDPLTPGNWLETWQWKRKEKYLQEIDGRKHLKKLSAKRTRLDDDLKRAFSELIRIKTYIGLHMNMTERVQGALMRFVSAVAKIGKGTGKRAPRHRREAYKAMQDCYAGVPCWIMPTWRVCESLPSSFGSFDLVIVDEASQSDITALPAMMRAKKLLVVGDDKQVSPTAAFLAEEKILRLKHNFLKNQPFEELLLPGSSLYDLANTVFPSQRIMLTEHFRCVEPIIRFSMQFYDEPLIPLRIPKSSEKLTPPLIDIYVKGGIRDERKKINEFEAEAIVDEINRLTNDPKYKNRSIGVISLIGKQQAKHIQELLINELGEGTYEKYKISCGDAPVFQGKERDIVFLSMVVGPDQGAPLTRREYERRINVALSRARDRMYLFRSVQESDLSNESDLRLKILRHFSNPMPREYEIDNPMELCDSDFERDVFNFLTQKGYHVIPQVKVGAFSIDLVVEGDNDRRLAIELDGDKYHPPEKWMDDWNRQRTMERVGWKFWRCWGSSYTIDPVGCMDDLINVLNKMQIKPCKKSYSPDIYTEYRVYDNESAMAG